MRSIRFATGLLVLAFILTSTAAGVAIAQDKSKPATPQVVTKVLLENDKVRVYESHFKLGAESASRERKPRVSYAVKGGTLLRTYTDGKTEKSVRKTGEAEWLAGGTYSVKNIGKTEVVLVAVEVK